MVSQSPKILHLLENCTVELDDGTHGFVFTYEIDERGIGSYFCHVCQSTLFGETVVHQHIAGKKHSSGMDKTYHPAMNFSRIVEDETGGVQSGEPALLDTDDINEPTKCLIQLKLDSFKSKPLIGLEYLVELLVEDADPNYFCVLCNKKGVGNNIIVHLSSSIHYLKYLKKHFYTVYKALSLVPRTSEFKKGHSIVLKRIIGQIENKLGRLKPKQCYSDEFEKGQNYIIFSDIKNGHHFRETSKDKDDFVKMVNLTEIKNLQFCKEGEVDVINEYNSKSSKDKELLESNEDKNDISLFNEDGQSKDKKSQIHEDTASFDDGDDKKGDKSHAVVATVIKTEGTNLSQSPSKSSLSDWYSSHVIIPNFHRQRSRTPSPVKRSRSVSQSRIKRKRSRSGSQSRIINESHVTKKKRDYVSRRKSRSISRSHSRSVSRSNKKSRGKKKEHSVFVPSRRSQSNSRSSHLDKKQDRPSPPVKKTRRSRSRSRSIVIEKSRSKKKHSVPSRQSRSNSRSSIDEKQYCPSPLPIKKKRRSRSQSISIEKSHVKKKKKHSDSIRRSRSNSRSSHLDKKDDRQSPLPDKRTRKSHVKKKKRHSVQRSRSSSRSSNLGEKQYHPSPLPNKKTRGLTSRSRSRSESIIVKESINPGDYKSWEYKWEKFREELRIFTSQLEDKYISYEKNSEEHPQYYREWKFFWRQRSKELEAEGKDPDKYDLTFEWERFWKKRMKEIYDEEYKIGKDKIKSMISFHDNRRNKLCARNTSGNMLFEKKKDEDVTVDDIKNTLRPLTASQLRERTKSCISSTVDITEPILEDIYGKRQKINLLSKLSPPPPGALEGFIPFDDNAPKVISVLRMISVLESQLESLGPKVVDLLSKAIAMEKLFKGSSEYILHDEEQSLLFETVKERLKGMLYTGMIDRNLVNLSRKAIKNIDDLFLSSSKVCKKETPSYATPTATVAPFPITLAPVTVPAGTVTIPAGTVTIPAGTVTGPNHGLDMVAIARIIYGALVLHGRKDVSEEELELMINTAVTLAVTKQAEPIIPQIESTVSHDDNASRRLKLLQAGYYDENKVNIDRNRDLLIEAKPQTEKATHLNNSTGDLSDKGLEFLLENWRKFVSND